MSALDDIIMSQRRLPRRLPCVCGAPTTARLLVQVQRLDEKRSASGSSVTISRNFCDDCAARIYADFVTKVRP